MRRTGGLCLERVVFCRERAIRFPGVILVSWNLNSPTPQMCVVQGEHDITGTL